MKCSSHKKSETDSINKSPIILDHLFTSILKDTESNLTLKKRWNEEVNENKTIENLRNFVININAEIMEIKSFIKYELYSFSKNIGQVMKKKKIRLNRNYQNEYNAFWIIWEK